MDLEKFEWLSDLRLFKDLKSENELDRDREKEREIIKIKNDNWDKFEFTG